MRVAHGRVRRVVGGLGQPFGACNLGAIGRQRAVAIAALLHDAQRAVGLRRHVHQRRPRAVEVTDDEGAVAEAAGERPGVSIHPKNRRLQIGALLLDDEAPGLFTLVGFVGNLPHAGDVRQVGRRGRRGRVVHGTERAAVAVLVVAHLHLADERAVLLAGDDVGQVVIEPQDCGSCSSPSST